MNETPRQCWCGGYHGGVVHDRAAQDAWITTLASDAAAALTGTPDTTTPAVTEEDRAKTWGCRCWPYSYPPPPGTRHFANGCAVYPENRPPAGETRATAAEARDRIARWLCDEHTPTWEHSGPMARDVWRARADELLAAALAAERGKADALRAAMHALAEEIEALVRPRSFMPAGTHGDGASAAYADAAARLRAIADGQR